MKISQITAFLSITILSLSWLQCTSDTVPLVVVDEDLCTSLDPRYSTNVKPIIDSSCAVAGCHVTGGDGPGNYINYNNILPFLEGGSFRQRTIVLVEDPILGMPPNFSINGPIDLPEDQFELISCWLDAGFPE